MKKRIFSTILAFFVVLSFSVPTVVLADDSISSEATVQSFDILSESFIEYDYETKTETIFTYADVVNSLREINPNYTNFTAPFSMQNSSSNVINNGTQLQTQQLSTDYYNKIEDYTAPYKYTMRIEVIKSDGSPSYGTGFMVSKYVMLTCAHVVWGDDVEEIKIYPFNNETISSLENETYYHPRTWVVSTNYTNATDSETRAHYDWCYLTLHEPLGEETGYYAFVCITDTFNNVRVSLTGYPGNNTIIPNFERYAQYMIEGYASVLNTQRIIHDCAALAGHSGSPIYLPGNTVIAVYTGGRINHYGVRITTTLYNLLTNRIIQVG